MKVLWFSPTPSLYDSKRWGHNGGGWIASLQNIITLDDQIELAVAFNSEVENHPKRIDKVQYFPIYSRKSLKSKIFNEDFDATNIKKALKIIESFNPDIIQLFGSEQWYGILVRFTNKPIIIHMQGSLPSYYDARYPAGMSVLNKIFSFNTSIKDKLMSIRIDQTFKKNALREEKILKDNKYFLGRTHWDKSIVNFFNSDAKYYVCQESLRDVFINSNDLWEFKNSSKVKFISVISGPLYKGIDFVLKTARLLFEHTKINFEWSICGVDSLSFFEEVYKIDADKVCVNAIGILSQNDLKNRLISSSLFIHPSYIENSPNSVCEAQSLGIPVIATNVGGISSLIKNKETGFLVPANDSVKLAQTIKKYHRNESILKKISNNAIKEAAIRHDPNKIKNTLISIYKNVLNDH